MKYILTVILLLSSILSTLAGKPQKHLVQFDEPAVVKQALEYLKTAKPDISAQKLELLSVQYNFNPKPDGYFQRKSDGTETFIKTADTTEGLTVTFKVLGSEKKIIENGRNCIRRRTLNVSFPHAASPAAGVTDGTETEYRDIVK